MKRLILIMALALAVVAPSQAQKLGKFGGLTQKKFGPKTIRIPYTDLVSYKGYAADGTEDAIVDGKKFHFIYVWIPAIAPELGVRMMSPVGKSKVKKAIEAKEYTAHAESKEFFDTYITLERSDIFTVGNINKERVNKANWFTLARNDDSSEMPRNPRKSRYNSLLRYKSVASKPLEALTVGLYRIGFTSYKKGKVNGTFLAQIGSPVKIPGIVMAKTIAELNVLIAESK